MRALEKEPGERFQEAPTAFIAALDKQIAEPGAKAGGTAAFRRLPPVVATPAEDAGRPIPRTRRPKAQAPMDRAAVVAGTCRRPRRLGATRGHTTDVPKVTGNELQRRDALLGKGRILGRRSEEGRARIAGKHRARRRPGPPPDPRRKAASTASS